MWLLAATGTAALGAIGLGVASAVSGTWVPVVCATLAAAATMGAAWVGNRRLRTTRDRMSPRERDLEERLFAALKDREELHDMVAERDALLISERRLNRQLRRQIRDAKSS